MSGLDLRGIVKGYTGGGGVVRAVNGVSLTVRPGEFVALYGPSGSGKTTLLMIAATILRPDSGTVCFDGRSVADLSDADGALFRRRDLGFVFQSFHLMNGATAVDNAAVKLLADGWSVADARTETLPWLERVGLHHRSAHTPARMSSGECQRVAIARALVNRPRLLLADEPTGNLDSQRGGEILGLLRDLCHERQIPVLLVTHDAQAVDFVDRAHTLRDGVLIEGPSEPLDLAREART